MCVCQVHAAEAMEMTFLEQKKLMDAAIARNIERLQTDEQRLMDASIDIGAFVSKAIKNSPLFFSSLLCCDGSPQIGPCRVSHR